MSKQSIEFEQHEVEILRTSLISKMQWLLDEYRNRNYTFEELLQELQEMHKTLEKLR